MNHKKYHSQCIARNRAFIKRMARFSHIPQMYAILAKRERENTFHMLELMKLENK